MKATTKEIGVTVLDEDHDELEFILEGLNAALYSKEYNSGKMEKAFNELHEHIKEHFQREEAWMAKAGYPGIKSHVQQHKKILEGLENFGKQLSADPTLDSGVDAYSFATEFLIDHTIGADQVLGGYLDYSKRKLGSYH